MAKKPTPGRCVHCLENVDNLTDDHVFPKGWYPTSTPVDDEKWKIPACERCNKEYGVIEDGTLSRLGLCVAPTAPGSVGIPQKTLRAVNPDYGKNEKDAHARKARRNKILGEAFFGNNIPEEAVAIYSDNPDQYKQRMAVLVSQDDLYKILKKIVKGITFMADKLYIDEKQYIFEFELFTGEEAPELRRELNEFGTIHQIGPGIKVTRVAVSDDRILGKHLIEIWGPQLKALAFVRKNHNYTKEHKEREPYK